MTRFSQGLCSRSTVLVRHSDNFISDFSVKVCTLSNLASGATPGRQTRRQRKAEINCIVTVNRTFFEDVFVRSAVLQLVRGCRREMRLPRSRALNAEWQKPSRGRPARIRLEAWTRALTTSSMSSSWRRAIQQNDWTRRSTDFANRTLAAR